MRHFILCQLILSKWSKRKSEIQSNIYDSKISSFQKENLSRIKFIRMWKQFVVDPRRIFSIFLNCTTTDYNLLMINKKRSTPQRICPPQPPQPFEPIAYPMYCQLILRFFAVSLKSFNYFDHHWLHIRHFFFTKRTTKKGKPNNKQQQKRSVMIWIAGCQSEM